MKYVCTGATLKCTMGTSTTKLKATPKNVSLTGENQANIADYVSMVNVPSFGKCRSLGYPPTASATAANHGKLTPMPCVPGTCPKWKAMDKDSLICGEPALLEPAILKCMYGGTISIVSPGQMLEIKMQAVSQSLKANEQETIEQEIPEELLQEFNELNTEGLNKDSVLDGVQLALDAAGMVPVLGAVPDLINASISVLRGDWVGAGLSIVAAVPGVGDVVGGAKIAYKGAKIATKSTKVNKVATVSQKSKVHGENYSTKVGTSIKNNQINTPKNFSNKTPIDKERQRLREIRAKRAGINPKETHCDILYDKIDNVSGGANSSPSGFDKSHTVQSVKSPKGVTSDKHQNLFGEGVPQNAKSNTQSGNKLIDTNTQKDYEMTKQAMKNAENKVSGKNLNIEI